MPPIDLAPPLGEGKTREAGKTLVEDRGASRRELGGRVRTTRPAGLSTLLHLEGVYTIKNVLDWVKSVSWCAHGG
jgi:hypothetical protein